MKRPFSLCLFLIGSLWGVGHGRSPNVILILTDDQGTLDLGSYGADDLYTPHIDALADQGVKFTQFYVGAAICSPSRGSLLTGKSPQGAGLITNSPGNPGPYKGLPPQNITMAELFKANGYRTGHVGKWHLGHEKDMDPNGQGFDYSYGHMEGCIDNYTHFFYWKGPNRHDLWENGERVYDTGTYFQDRMVERARAFIAESGDRPFFLYFATNLPHYPLQPDHKWREFYKDLPMPRRDYAACMSTIDERVGDLIEILKAYGQYENTIIVFLSDHGHSCEERTFFEGGYAGPFRGAKFGQFEGGIRVPAIFAGPGFDLGKVVDSPAMAMDIFPTLADLLNLTGVPEDVEGQSLLNQIETGEPVRDTMFWKRNHRWTVRQGPWKLLIHPRDEAKVIPLDEEKDIIFLANLEMDITESKNLRFEYPERVKELVEVYKSWEHFEPKDLDGLEF